MPINKTSKPKKDGHFQYRVRVNYTDSYGNHKQISRCIYGKEQAKALEEQLTKQVAAKEIIDSMTLNQLFEEYTEQLQHEIRQTSMIKKKQMYKNHIASLSDVRLDKLNVRILSAWKKELNTKTLSSGAPLKLRTKQNAYKELRALLNYAVKMEYIPSNPIKKIDNFKDAYSTKSEINYYTSEEFKLYIAAALEDAEKSNYYDYYVFFNMAYFTGCRKGEIHALRWADISGNVLSVTKSICQKLKEGDIETPPKNQSSNRTLQMPLPLVSILNEHKARQQAYCKQLGQEWSDNNFICGLYKPLRDSSLDNKNRSYALAAGLHRIRIHDFRHSHASLLVNNNINILEVSRRLGHTNIEMTLNTYSHFFPKEEEKALEILNNF